MKGADRGDRQEPHRRVVAGGRYLEPARLPPGALEGPPFFWGQRRAQWFPPQWKQG